MQKNNPEDRLSSRHIYFDELLAVIYYDIIPFQLDMDSAAKNHVPPHWISFFFMESCLILNDIAHKIDQMKRFHLQQGET